MGIVTKIILKKIKHLKIFYLFNPYPKVYCKYLNI
jgi:hypothetical protein